MRDSTRLDGRPTRRGRERAQSVPVDLLSSRSPLSSTISSSETVREGRIGPSRASPRLVVVSKGRERMTMRTRTRMKTTRTRERGGRWRRDGRTTVVSRGGETRREESDGTRARGATGTRARRSSW